MYDPEAVFKSLSYSNNPNAYISVLNAKTDNKEQIIAILSPSIDGHGFTFIPSVYEKHNFDRFLENINKEQKVLYIKNKGSEIWGQLQSLPRHNSEPSILNISTKDDIVKHFNPSLERRENNSKEKIMSDANEQVESSPRDPREEAYLNALHQRKVISDALKNGTLSCLPGTDGIADTKPVVNLVNGTFYHGANMLYLKEHQKENGFPSGEYLTSEQLDRARKDNPELSIRKGEKGVSIYVSEKNEETGEYDYKSYRVFNVAQTTRPSVMKDWAEKQQQEKIQEKLEYLQNNVFGKNYQLPVQKQKTPGPDIVCSSTDPEKYLGQYLAAVSMGSKFIVTKEQAAEAAQKFDDKLYEKTGVSPKTGEAVSNPFSLSKISNEASQYCKEFTRDFRIEQQKINQPEQKLEQSHSRSM